MHSFSHFDSSLPQQWYILGGYLLFCSVPFQFLNSCKPGYQHLHANSGASQSLTFTCHSPFLPFCTTCHFFRSLSDTHIPKQSPVLATSPVIVDTESILPDSLVAACQEAHTGSLLASSDYEGSIASMSGYVKNPAYAYGMCITLRLI